MRHLTVNEVPEIYSRVVEQSGGAVGIRDMGALESAPHLPVAAVGKYPSQVVGVGQSLLDDLAPHVAEVERSRLSG